MMKKFWTLASVTLQSALYYRSAVMINLLSPAVQLIGQFLLWMALYAQQDGSSIQGYAQADMMTHYLLVFCISSLLTWSSENTLSREIRNGSIVTRRTRPVSFLTQSLAAMAGNMVFQAGINLLVTAAAFGLFPRFFVLPSARNLLPFAISLILGLMVRMMLVHCFSLLCFYTTGHLGITWTRNALSDFFSGALLPLAMFPEWLQRFSYCTPFPLTLQVPIALLLDRPLPFSFAQFLLLQLLWIGVFYLIHKAMYRHVSRNTTIAGG